MVFWRWSVIWLAVGMGFSSIVVATHPVSEDSNVPETRTEIKAKAELVENPLGMRFVRVAPGSFIQGAATDDPDFDVDESPRTVTISKAFYLQTTEVTQGQWMALMSENPSAFTQCGERCPVERVSYEMIQVYINQLNQLDAKVRYRLPTEAEWEYAARAGSQTPFNTGECLSGKQANVNGLVVRDGCETFSRSQGPVPVASYPPNDWGLYDMHGNVWELCEDWYAPYHPDAVTDPTGASAAKYRVLRGGSWRFYPSFSRSANRLRAFKNIGGFRLVRESAVVKLH